MENKKKFKVGKKDVLPPGPINYRDVKVRISIMIDGDVLQAIKERAASEHEKYQPWINKQLRKAVLGDGVIGARGALEAQNELSELIAELEGRVRALESQPAVSKRKAG